MKLESLSHVKKYGKHGYLLQNGIYLEPLDNFGRNATYEWRIMRLMHDEPIGLVTYSLVADTGFYKVDLFSDGRTIHGKYRAPSLYFFADEINSVIQHEIERGRLVLGEDLFSDLRRARKSKREQEASFWLIRLNNDGSESRAHDAKKIFSSPREAIDYHNRMVDFNPGKVIQHALYGDGLGLIKKKLVGKIK